MHKPFMRFTVHLPDRDIFFKKKRKMHIADFSYRDCDRAGNAGTGTDVYKWISFVPRTNIYDTGQKGN